MKNKYWQDIRQGIKMFLRMFHTHPYPVLSQLIFGKGSFWAPPLEPGKFPAGVFGGLIIGTGAAPALWLYFYEVRRIRRYAFFHVPFFLFLFFVLPLLI